MYSKAGWGYRVTVTREDRIAKARADVLLHEDGGPVDLFSRWVEAAPERVDALNASGWASTQTVLENIGRDHPALFAETAAAFGLTHEAARKVAAGDSPELVGTYLPTPERRKALAKAKARLRRMGKAEGRA